MNGQPWLFKWQQFEAEIIVCAVRWYLRYSLSGCVAKILKLG